MATAQITAVLKAHCSTGIARYTWTVYTGHNSEYCLEGKKDLKSILIDRYVHAELQGKGRGKMLIPGPCLHSLLVVVFLSQSQSDASRC